MDPVWNLQIEDPGGRARGMKVGEEEEQAISGPSVVAVKNHA
jgi:hypothetical protein